LGGGVLIIGGLRDLLKPKVLESMGARKKSFVKTKKVRVQGTSVKPPPPCAKPPEVVRKKREPWQKSARGGPHRGGEDHNKPKTGFLTHPPPHPTPPPPPQCFC